MNSTIETRQGTVPAAKSHHVVKNTIRALLLGGASTLCVTAAYAEPGANTAESAGGGGSADSASRLDEVIVTAQKRSENLQKVPISVTALNADAVLDGGAVSTQSLQLTVPSLAFNRTGNEGNIFMRGVGTNLVGPNVEQAVAIYVDGVYHSSPEASVFGFDDIDRIEVLKGPQGTLFGRNTTGGVIQIFTKDPTWVPSARLEADYGNYETVRLSGFGSTPIGSKAALSLSATYDNQGKGFGHNIYNGEEIGIQAKDNFAIRSKLLIEASPTTKLRLTADHSQLWENNTYRLSDAAVGPDGTLPPGTYDANANFPEHTYMDDGGGSVQIDQKIGDYDLRSISALRRTTTFWQLNQDGVPAALTEDTFLMKVHTFTQELHLGGKTGNLEWLVGGFFYDAKAGVSKAVVKLDNSLEIDITDYQYTKSWAAFSQGTYALTDRTKVTLGVRWTNERQRFETENFAVGGGVIPVPTARQSYGVPTYRASVDHQITDDILGYVSFNHGFKSGGYNVLAPTDPAYKAEKINAYEAGLKTTLLDDRLRLNTAAFLYDYQNIQAQVPIPGGNRVLNGPKARIKGVDANLEAKLVRNLTLSGGVSFLDGKYPSYPGAPFVNPEGVLTPQPTSATGNTTIATPRFTGDLSLTHLLDTSIGSFSSNVSVSHNSGFYYYPDNRIQQPSYTVLNASLTWAPRGDRYSVRLYGRNLTSAIYYIGRSEQVGNADIDRAAPPRTYGVGFVAKF